jgi:hypothetical protein
VAYAPVTSKDKAPNTVLLQSALLLWIATGLPVFLPHSSVIPLSPSRQIMEQYVDRRLLNIAVGL